MGLGKGYILLACIMVDKFFKMVCCNYKIELEKVVIKELRFLFRS